ncbi:extracellular solute-binding protein [Kutzneria albida]|uniref:Sugar ABC transporter substrate-binding protein n=1 Tax=Kutzneria albida DSM 43870 TaxID=1449976 RepID=W5WJ54_9PSEU|nr:extracellular solute-binding protein [Kutzneria albida]AHI00908.1 hypothetical protein KALB_7550 [Kutzneria albida DSM 43870]
MNKLGVALAAALLLSAGCTGQSGNGSSPTTLTYWASNQGSSLDNDRQVLQPELDEFAKQTGITVKLEVVPWPDLLNRILAAATSGQGPDVINIGNTWAASLQATGAFAPFDDSALNGLGGAQRFLAGSLAATGAAGQTRTSVPLYGLAYGLFYNKKLFREAGIGQPPTTWEEFTADAKRLTHGDQWGLAVEGSSITENAHHAFILGQQYGSDLFDASGKPQFDTPQQVAAVRQYLEFMGTDKVVNPSNAEYGNGTQALHDLATGKAGMVLWQGNAETVLKANGMRPEDYGIAPMPFPQPTPAGGKHINSLVAGINLAVFANSGNKDGAMRFVKFLTSAEEQRKLNKSFGTLPVVQDAYQDPVFQTPAIKSFQQVLAGSAAPLPQIAQESQFETTVGGAIKDLFAQIAGGKPVGDAEIKAALSAAQQKMATGG